MVYPQLTNIMLRTAANVDVQCDHRGFELVSGQHHASRRYINLYQLNLNTVKPHSSYKHRLVTGDAYNEYTNTYSGYASKGAAKRMVTLNLLTCVMRNMLDFNCRQCALIDCSFPRLGRLRDEAVGLGMWSKLHFHADIISYNRATTIKATHTHPL